MLLLVSESETLVFQLRIFANCTVRHYKDLSLKRGPADDIQVLSDKARVLEHQVTRLYYSTSTDLEVGGRIIDDAKQVSFDNFLPVSTFPQVYQLDLEDDVLKMPCANDGH